jgi:DNA-binding IclR family transcriptional regulator
VRTYRPGGRVCRPTGSGEELGHPAEHRVGELRQRGDESPADKVVVRDLETLHAELARIRARGYALLDEELEEGVVGASAPVRDLTGSIVAAINVSAPRSRVSARLPELGTFAARGAAALTAELGGPTGPARPGPAARAGQAPPA